MPQTVQAGEHTKAAGLPLTLEVLAQTPNRAATGVLVGALAEPDERLREMVAEALLARHSPAGDAAVLQRLHSFSEEWIAHIQPHFVRMDLAVRSCLLKGTDQAKHNRTEHVSQAAQCRHQRRLGHGPAARPRHDDEGEVMIGAQERVYQPDRRRGTAEDNDLAIHAGLPAS